MKEDLRAWYQGLEYEEGLGPCDVFPSQRTKKQINTYVIISMPDHAERQ